MIKWKRYTIQSYTSSLFTEDDSSIQSKNELEQLMNSDNFTIAALKNIAYDSLKRQWTFKAKQEKQLKAQEFMVIIIYILLLVVVVYL